MADIQTLSQSVLSWSMVKVKTNKFNGHMKNLKQASPHSYYTSGAHQKKKNCYSVNE